MDTGRGGQLALSGRVQLIARPVASTIGRAHPQGWSRKDGVSRPTVIFTPCLEESKGENDLPQLQNQMSEVRKRPQGQSAIPLLLMLQDLQ
jgi:hypothetical protein